GALVPAVLRERGGEREECARVGGCRALDEVCGGVGLRVALGAVGDVEEGERELRVVGRGGARAGEVFGGLREVARVAVERAEVVVCLDVRRISLQHALELRDGVGGLAALGQEASEVVVCANEVRVETDGCAELREGFVAAPLAVEYDAEEVMRDGRARCGGDRRARRALSFCERALTQILDRLVERCTCRRAQLRELRDAALLLRDARRTPRRRSLLRGR